MKTTIFLILASAFFLTSCSSGGDGTTSTGDDVLGDDNPSLIFAYATAPLQPVAVNLFSPDGVEENSFVPGDTITLMYFMTAQFSDGAFTGLGDQYLYDTSIYFSNDTTLDPGTDLKLFTVECSLPRLNQYVCGENASFSCVYAKDNANTLTCSSIDFPVPTAFKEVVIDTTEFLDAIPKDAHVIFKACLREDPTNCAQADYPIQLK